MSAELSRRVEKVVRYSPLCELSESQRREFNEALLKAAGFEDLPGGDPACGAGTGRTCASLQATSPL